MEPRRVSFMIDLVTTVFALSPNFRVDRDSEALQGEGEQVMMRAVFELPLVVNEIKPRMKW